MIRQAGSPLKLAQIETNIATEAAKPDECKKVKTVKKVKSKLKVLPTSEIQRLAAKFKVSWREIYRLDADY